MPEPAWPPKSPRDALLGSPSGRKRYRDLLHQRQTSPSPNKRSAPLASSMRATRDHDYGGEEHHEDVTDNDGEEDDEESLQLQLQAIEAKLRLKKLQSKKVADVNTGLRNERSALNQNTSGGQSAGRTRPALSRSSVEESAGDIGAMYKDPAVKSIMRSKSAAGTLQVPLSPAKRRSVPEMSPSRSPSRVLLGIDKGRSGADVSLRRPPPADRRSADTLRNTTSSMMTREMGAATVGAQAGKTFNERMAERREKEKENLERKARSEALRQQRSAGFDLKNEELEAFKRRADGKREPQAKASSMRQPTGFSREQILGAVGDPRRAAKRNYEKDARNDSRATGTIRRSNTSLSQKPQGRDRPNSSLLQSKSMDFTKDRASPDESDTRPRRIQATESDLHESISSTPLTRRILPHSFVERTMKDKTHVPLVSMLRHVKAPDWELPEDVAPPDSDFVVFAIIGSKSAPLDHRGTTRSHDDKSKSTKTSAEEAEEATLNDMKKYMVFTLVSTCLRWSVDLYLFGTGYTRWRNLTPGTLIAILNPGIMPPPPGKANTNRWSMKLGSSDDTILEIGTSSDMGWCKAVKKDGHKCGAWIDATALEYCEYHVEMNVERIKAGRMDAQGGSGFQKDGKGRGGGGGWGWKKKEKADPHGVRFDRDAQSTYYVAQSGAGFGFAGRSAASLLDLEVDRGGSQEKTRKMLAQREKERDLARELGRSGRGAGAEYMSRHGAGGEDRTLSGQKGNELREDASKPKGVRELGLQGGKAGEVQLSPLKRKKSALDLIGSTRARKKTRFVTEKGIKVAGRESLPNAVADDGSDDDLEIV